MADKKKTRTVLTPAERIARAEAELAAVREKESAKAQAKVEKKQAELDKAIASIDKATARANKLQEELDDLLDLVTPENQED